MHDQYDCCTSILEPEGFIYTLSWCMGFGYLLFDGLSAFSRQKRLQKFILYSRSGDGILTHHVHTRKYLLMRRVNNFR